MEDIVNCMCIQKMSVDCMCVSVDCMCSLYLYIEDISI